MLDERRRVLVAAKRQRAVIADDEALLLDEKIRVLGAAKRQRAIIADDDTEGGSCN